MHVAAIVLAFVFLGSEPSDKAGLANCDFEEGLEGWSVWYSDDPKKEMTRYPYTADPTVAHSGGQSLRIDAPDENGCAFVSRTSDQFKPGSRYAVSYWYRSTPGLDEGKFSLRFNCRPADPEASSWVMKALEPLVLSRKREGEWQYREGRVQIHKDAQPRVSLGIYLREARGSVWVDDIQVREVAPGEDAIADLWIYDPHRVELGSAPLNAFRKLKESNDPILGRAARYNEILVQSAQVKENVRRLKRLAGYGGAIDGKAIEHVWAAMDQAERRLAALYESYGRMFLDRDDPEKAADFDRSAAALAEELNGLQREVAAAIASAIRERKDAGFLWAPPRSPLDSRGPAISPDGRVNQIIYAKRSLWDFQELEKPLGMDRVHSTTLGTPTSSEPGKYDWSAYLEQWDVIKAGGTADKSCLLLFMALHDNCYTPAWLAERFQSVPELLHQTEPTAKLRQWGNRAQLNWWHPEVQDYARELVGDMGRTFRDRDEFLFYVFQWECYGPYVGTDTGIREVGYGKHAQTDFVRWLREKYGDIRRLNARWKTGYTGFERITPPPDRYVVERRHTGPLASDWETWREASYRDWCRLIYQAWKEADPTKPVLAGHSQLLRRFNMPDVYDTCDILSFHSGGREFLPGLIYARSLSRYNGHKPLGQYENFWGIQEDHDRMHEELARRHGAQRHIFRMTASDLFLQVWWYAYTTADYLTHYDGNFFDPSYALTTLRYRTAALPVYFEKFRRLQRALLDSRIVPSRIAMLAPSASMRNNFPEAASQAEARDLLWQLFPRNYACEYVPEEYFLDGRTDFADFDVLILPYAVYLSGPLQEKIGDWLKSEPRLLLACGPFGLYDELGIPSGDLFKAALGPLEMKFESPSQRRWEWKVESPDSQKGLEILEGRIGPSRVLVSPRMISELQTNPAIVDRLLAAVEKTAERAAYDEKNALELVVRRQGDTLYLCVANPDLDDPVETKVHVRGEFPSIVDLDYEQGYPVAGSVASGSTAFSLCLEAGEATILRLMP